MRSRRSEEEEEEDESGETDGEWRWRWMLGTGWTTGQTDSRQVPGGCGCRW